MYATESRSSDTLLQNSRDARQPTAGLTPVFSAVTAAVNVSIDLSENYYSDSSTDSEEDRRAAKRQLAIQEAGKFHTSIGTVTIYMICIGIMALTLSFWILQAYYRKSG
jgi:hypothetical protein